MKGAEDLGRNHVPHGEWITELQEMIAAAKATILA
jgi:hypothetical protein